MLMSAFFNFIKNVFLKPKIMLESIYTDNDFRKYGM
jgi:hypothetical protein